MKEIVFKTAEQRQAFERKGVLMQLSKNLRSAISEGHFDTMNEALISYYKAGDHEITELNTFEAWKRKGFTVVRGAVSFLIWGQPYTNPQDAAKEIFPVRHLFSNLQVRSIKAKKALQAEDPTEAMPLVSVNELDHIVF